MAEYYSQRLPPAHLVGGHGGLSPMAWLRQAPGSGRRSRSRLELTTRAVHRAGGRIFLQLWHVGRISDPSFLNGALPVAPSAVAAKGNVNLVRPPTPFVTPRALARQEIPQVIEAFRKGAENAQLAGFDGVELHGANGYLLDQFLQDGSNMRSDDYGGSIENRARLMLEAVDAVISVWGAGSGGRAS